jgi:hypothetical protein
LVLSWTICIFTWLMQEETHCVDFSSALWSIVTGVVRAWLVVIVRLGIIVTFVVEIIGWSVHTDSSWCVVNSLASSVWEHRAFLRGFSVPHYNFEVEFDIRNVFEEVRLGRIDLKDVLDDSLVLSGQVTFSEWGS